MKNYLLSGVAALGILAAGAASAADLPSRKGPVAAPYYPPAFTWTGFYIGANAGYAWGQVDSSALGTLNSFDDPDGFVGGGQVGYNYQIGQWVLGVEADFQGADLKATASDPFFGLRASNELNWFGTVRGRVGYAFDRFLPYVTGGFAYGNVKNKISGPGFSVSDDNTQYGWTLGGGLEYAFTNNLTVKAEYLYVDLDKESIVVPGGTFTGSVGTKFSVARVGLNYKF
ncbi:porin family protein [Bosea caraganae]|uniref:Porin family protein n=1 Tax=Bosea caraganae TaxID=2763117 RepID=A0A370L6C7_9HYPH|nr:outer membrane protein [Bosea caraganae]RDJ25286.1 porin family protein [Bosea caraganae]RDJ25931.1 porin family protein [Bosea caraganae]